MTITPDLFAAYLKCPTKCWLRQTGEPASGNAYAEWVRERNEACRVEGVKRLIAEAPEGSVAREPPTESLKMATWRLATDVIVRTENRETQIAAVERVPSEGRGKAAQFVPVRFVWRNKLHRDDKLLLAFDAMELSETLGRDVPVGKIIHGDDSAVLNVKLAPLMNEARKIVEKTVALLASPAPPDLVLNRHCAECEFQTRCRKIAVEKDDLSLLGGMSEKERQKLRSKGIFTVTQLSYTFRPRRTPKRAKNSAKPRYFALQALAIREDTVYIHGTPILPQSKTRVFLDIEGLPDRDFYYLIGLSIVSEGRDTFQSYWADTPADETALFAQFVESVSLLEDFRVFHFGDYDVVALKRKRPLLSEIHRQKLDAILGKCTNVLSALYPHVYFPTYSNGLKDIGKFVGPDHSSGEATGLHSVVWRHDWEASRELALRAKLIEYNRTDCMLLTDLCDFLVRETFADGSRAGGTAVRHTQEAIVDRPYWRLFGAKKYALEELGQINKRAYFDYQREKVLVRTHRHFKAVNKRSRKLKKTSIRPNETNSFELKRCPKCGSRNIRPIREMSHILVDVKFSRSGVKKWVKDERSCRYRCLKCAERFSSVDRLPNPQRHGHGLASWVLYLNIGCGLNMGRVAKSLGEVFKIYLDSYVLFRLRAYTVRLYESLYTELLGKILHETAIHVDETTVHLSKGQRGYVWVLTSADKVYYFYKPSREGTFLEETLNSFSGVLVSDFYTAYDSLPCQQQKCLAHLVRDIDDDLLKNPFDKDFKDIATEFGSLLKAIVQTVDRYGLKKRFLHKHKTDVRRFLESMASRKSSSDLAMKLQKRFQKSGSKMFTFLNYDGVPWNNNNAEHAIKRFAKHRRNANGMFTEASLKEYLIMASVLETCDFNNVSVLDFLVSKETTLNGLFGMAGRKADSFPGPPSSPEGSPTSLPTDGIPDDTL